MEKERVIKLRETLKAGKNFPLRIFINNMYQIIDESKTAQFTSWDDVNGMLYMWKLPDLSTNFEISNKRQGVSVFVCDYEAIEAMEISNLPLDQLDTVFDSIKSSGKDLKEGFTDTIKTVFKNILSYDLNVKSRDAMNKMVGSSLPTSGYYNDHMDTPYKETAEVQRYNESIKDIQEKYKK